MEESSSKRPHSPSGVDEESVKKPKVPPGGFYGGPPGWGPPPPPFPDSYGSFSDDFEFGSHRDEWYPGTGPPPPPPPPPPPKSSTEDFSDDTFAIYGPPRGRGDGDRGFRSRGFRGGFGPFRGGPRGFRNFSQGFGPYRGRGRGNERPRGRGGPPHRGNRGQNSDRGGAAGGFRGRGMGQIQKGMPPNMFANRGAKKAKAQKATTNTVPPVHSLAKVTLDVSSMSVAEKIHRFSLYVRNDPMKENAIQHIMNAQTGSKLMLKVEYEAEELAKVGSKHMYTGRLALGGVFLARAVCVNKKELKHLVFQKALNILLQKTVAEIYNLVDPGVETLREELEREEEAENQKKDTRVRDWMGQDIGEAFQIIIDKLKTKVPTVDSDIARIEQAITSCSCVIRHQFLLDTIRHKNGRHMYKGALEINNIVIARGRASSKKQCKRATYSSAMESLMNKSLQDLLIPIPEEEEEEEEDEKEPEHQKPSAKGAKVVKLSKKEKFAELLKSMKTQPFKESNVNPIDVTAMQFGIVPMAVYRKLKEKNENENISCELYLDNIFIASAEGRKRNGAQKEAYSKAWELLTTTDVDTILTQHPSIDDEGLQAPDVADILVKGGGKRTESNLAALRRFGRPDHDKSLKKDDLVIVEHADWSNDRIRNSFCILQCSCTQNGMLLKWTTEGTNSKYYCEIFVQDEHVGSAHGTTKQSARSLAMSDALFQLYESQDVVRISRRDDSQSWIPWQTIVEEAAELKKLSPLAEEPEPEVKTDEKGFFLPDQFVLRVVSKRLEDFADTSDFKEVIIGPGMPATESREIRFKAKQLKIMVDVRQHHGESYSIFYKKLNYIDLVKLLKTIKKPYGKYELVPPEELPKHEEIDNLLLRAKLQTRGSDEKEEDMAVDND